MPETPTVQPSTPSVQPATSTLATESIGTGANQVIFASETPAAAPAPEAVTPPEVSPIPDAKPYHVSELENGQFEVKLDSGAVYRGTQLEVINHLAEGKYQADRHIAEIKGKGPFAAPTVPSEQVTPVAPGQLDPTGLALVDLIAPVFGAKNAEELNKMLSVLPSLQENYQQQQMNQVAASFLAMTPDFPMSDRNVATLDEAFTGTGMAMTPQNIRMVHNHLKSEGVYEKVATAAAAPTSTPMPRAPNGQFTSQNGEIDEQAMWAMPFNEFEALARRRQ